MMQITVVYVKPGQQCCVVLAVDAATTVHQAILRSGLLNHFTEIRLGETVVGIFGRKVALDALLQPGDRIEIYRPLPLDPKAARRKRTK